MAFGEGANWEGNTHIIAGDAVTFELHVASTPMIGAVRVRFEVGEGPVDIAANLANEWNERQPIKDVLAIAERGSGLTAFFLTGPLADGAHEIKSMAATFDGKPREEMPQVGDSVSSFLNENLSVTRTAIQVNFATTTKVKSMQTTKVVGGAQTKDPVHT